MVGSAERVVVPIHPAADVVPLGRFTVHDIDTLRLMLRGSSVVDWYRLHFKTKEEVDAYIRLNELNPDDPEDGVRLRELQIHALRYLAHHLGYNVPDPVAEADLRTLLLYASGQGRRSARLYACLILKVMHIIHYVEAHELQSRLAISPAEISTLLHAKVERVVRGLLERNFPIVEFSGNSKAYDSIISKLLAKKDTQAAQVFDKLRFRLVVERLEDVPALLIALQRELVPFNYLVPNQAENTLVDLDHMLVRSGNVSAIRLLSEGDAELNEPNQLAAHVKKNEFSGPDYKVVHFVAEIPVRIDRVMPFQSARLMGLGPVVFGTVEFQVIDQVTSRTNETGENRHSAYKLRQRSKVKERLERGKRKKGT